MQVQPKIVVSAGMPRSGSTWLYNAIRLNIEMRPELAGNVSYGWIGDWAKIEKRQRVLLKVHDFDRRLVDSAESIFYSYRDVRDAVASYQRKFGAPATIELAASFIQNHESWMKEATFIMRYEDMIQAPLSVVTGIREYVEETLVSQGSAGSNPAADKLVLQQIGELEYNSKGATNNVYNETNLLHKGHITDGSHGAWKKTIGEELGAEIRDKFAWWFEKYGY